MNKKLLRFFISLLFFCLYLSVNATCNLVAKCMGGNWSAASTWVPASCGGINTPTDGVIIIIPACATVTVDINSPSYNNMEIYVYGTLDFDNGQKINMCPGYVKVFPGGQLTGGNPGSKIDICGVTVWNGGVATSGPLALGGSTTLPIELISFTAEQRDNNVNLLWTTASEKNNDFFTIEKTQDGFNFEEFVKVDGAGNSTSVLNYSTIDDSPFDGTSYYRLKQTDYNGDFTYSALVPMDFTRISEFGFEVYPNPSNGENVSMSLTAGKGEEVLVVVYDVTGKESYSKVIVTEDKGDSVYAVDPSNKLAPGIYVITATSQQKIYSKRLVVK